jgi:hypothetical protein
MATKSDSKSIKGLKEYILYIKEFFICISLGSQFLANTTMDIPKAKI